MGGELHRSKEGLCWLGTKRADGGRGWGGFSQKEGAEGGEMHRWYSQPVPRGINHGGIMAALAQKRAKEASKAES